MKSIILLLRPHQWLKNSFVFLPLFFDKHLFDWSYLFPALIAFFSFSFVASSIYCLNDLKDVEADRRHPKKCKRPIASGAVSVKAGIVLMFLSLFISIALTFALPYNERCALLSVTGFYYIVNVAYCFKLKQKAIIDLFTIALGFVLRILAGGVSANIQLSQWIVLMTFLLALFLALAKRRDDVYIFESTGVKMRKNVTRYNLAFMNQALGIVASITMVCYIMYTVSSDVIARIGSNYVYLTSLFVLAGILRYLQLAIVDTKSGSPTKVLLRDRFIQLCILGWLLLFAALIYLKVFDSQYV